MGNANAKPHPKPRSKKQVRWRAAERPSPPGKPHLLQENGLIPDLIHICWQKPEKDGGSPISLYLVEHRRVGSPHWLKSSSIPVINTELSVNGLEPGWRYQFRIRAENAVGLSDCSDISDPFTVILQRSAITAPKFTQELTDATVLEDSKLEFEVHFLGQPIPSICWFKDGFEIFSSNRIRIMTVSDKSILTILQATSSDEGEVKCTGTNKAGHASTKCKLTVEAPPIIRLPKSYQDQDGIIFEIGETITLNVHVGGRPTPLVFWSHDGESIQNDDRHELEYSDKTATLKIDNSIRSDRGEYQIKAVNKLSQDKASFLVTITDKPTPPGKARVLLTSGRSVTLSWSTPEDDGGCKIGNYIIEYYRVGWNVWLKAATCRQVTTMLGDLIEGSQYKFRVKAESPYGVSDPSEESETIFIPDSKRGINKSTDIISEKHKQTFLSLEDDRSRRANSSPRVSFSLKEDMPVRPERKKTGKTPEASPRMNRKQLPPIPSQKKNMELGPERAKLIRNMVLSFPETTLEQKSSPNYNKDPSISSVSRGSPTFSSTETDSKFLKYSPDRMQRTSQVEKTNSPSPEILMSHADIEQRKLFISSSSSNTPDRSPNRRRRSLSGTTSDETNNNMNPNCEKAVELPSEEKKIIQTDNRMRPPLIRQEFSGSSEFMLVLCPEGEQGAHFRKFGFDFEDDSIPPPLSLSAPELGTEPIQQPQLKRSSSSSELLNYHLMERLRQAVFEEQEKFELDRNREITKVTSQFTDIPTIQVNSETTDELVGLSDRSPANRRLSVELVSKHQPKWSQRRHSLKNAKDMNSKVFKLHRFQETDENRRELLKYRQETELDSQRKKTSISPEEKTISDDDWMKDYEESVPSDEEMNSSSDERISSNISPEKMYDDEEDEETYNPRNRVVRSVEVSNDEPFEILTVRKDPPDSSIVPKPILKKKTSSTNRNVLLPTEYDSSDLSVSNSQRKRSHSLTEYSQAYKSLPFVISEKKGDQNVREQFTSSTSTNQEQTKLGNINRYPNTAKQRSLSLIPSQANILKDTFKNRNVKSLSPTTTKTNPSKSVSALANFTSIAGAGLIIPEKMISNKNAEEEAKVVVDFYGDIVKNFGGKTKPTAEFSRMIDSKYDNFEERKISEIKSNIKTVPKIETDNQIPVFVNESKKEVTSSAKNMNEPVGSRNFFSDKFSRNIGSNSHPPHNLGVKEDQNPSITPSYQLRNSSESYYGRTNYKEFRNENSNVSPTRYTRGDTKTEKRSSPRRQQHTKRRNENSPSRPTSLTRKKTPSSRDASTSPVRFQNWEEESSLRNSLERDYFRGGSLTSSRSSSLNRRSLSPARPILREITTQTSFRVESPTPADVLRKQVELANKAEKRMKGVFEYFTDLAMVSVACWFYLFQNEYLAIPILIILVYRQLNEKMSKLRQSVKKRLPNWILKKFRGKDEGV